MTIVKIIILALCFFAVTVTCDVVLIFILGVDNISNFDSILPRYAIGFIITTFLFAGMTWAFPSQRPYLNAIKVGFLWYLIGVLFVFIWSGVWLPKLMILDVPMLLASVALGVSAGKKLKRHSSL